MKYVLMLCSDASAPQDVAESAVAAGCASSLGASLSADQFAQVGVPALVLDGGASPAWLREMARRVAATLPCGWHRSLPGQTHDVNPEALAPVLAEFLAAPSP